MASMDPKPVAAQQAQRDVKSELSLSTISDEQIMNQIYTTHKHDVEKFDTDSLFVVAQDILKRATNVVADFVPGGRAPQENFDDRTPNASFSPPLCTLKRLSSEMACKAFSDAIAHRTTISMLHELSSYSWDAKAVMALAAFAMEYGDFWLLAKLHPSDQLAKSVGILKRVPSILNSQSLQKYGKALIELNSVIKATSEVIECIIELEKLSIYDTKDVPELSTVMDHIPVDVFWAITTIVASTTQMFYLTTNEEKTPGLSFFAWKINDILDSLRKQRKLCYQQIEELEVYRKLKRILRTPTEIMEVFKLLIFSKDNDQRLIDGSTKESVDINVLRGRNVLLLISDLNISIDDVSILKTIYEEIKKEENYKIVWIPIVEEWTEDLKKKFETLQPMMPWYVVQFYSSSMGTKFIKEEWKFKNKPLFVVMSPQGKVEHPNALPMIRVWREKAFPFTIMKEKELLDQGDAMGTILTNVDETKNDWIKDQKYIFIYGGKDKDWIQQFEKKAMALKNDQVIQDVNISLELFCVQKNQKGEEDLSIQDKFWGSIESLFFCKTHNKTEADPSTQEIQKLLSYKDEDGWVILNKGARLVLIGVGHIILKVLDEFEKWKDNVRDFGFESSFKNQYNKISDTARRVYRFDIPIPTGKALGNLKAPEYPRVTEANVSFKFCQDDGSLTTF